VFLVATMVTLYNQCDDFNARQITVTNGRYEILWAFSYAKPVICRPTSTKGPTLGAFCAGF